MNRSVGTLRPAVTILAIAAVAVLSCAFADDPLAGRPMLDKPEWASVATQSQIENAWPDRAMRMGREGAGVVNCLVLPNGKLGSCAIVQQIPEGFYFGDAAKALASRFQVRPMSLAGAPPAVPAGYVVRLRINFTLDARLPQEFAVSKGG